MHFGLYLKKKGILTADQLVAALEIQLTTLPRIGQLALEEGIISPRDIFDVLHAQRLSPDVRFGELAIEMNLMTRDELTRLLMIQSDRKRPLFEIFIEQGMLSKERAGAEMSEFRGSQANRKPVKSRPSKIIPAPRGVTSPPHTTAVLATN